MIPTGVVSSLKLARLMRGAIQFEIARRAKLSAARLSLLERGHDKATTAEQTALAAALGVPVSQLFTGDGEARTAEVAQ